MPKYNIVMLNPDQIRADYTTSGGHPFIETTNLTRLEEMGVYFNNAYTVCPMCGPTRTSFVTGQYPLEHQVRNYGGTMPEDYPNAISLLKENGYRVALFGKDHIIAGNAIGRLYDEGEDVALRNMIGHPEYIHSYSCGTLEPDSRFNETARLTSDCLKFIEKEVKKGEPFLANINLHDPHPFFACVEPYKSMFKPEQFELPENFRTGAVPGEPHRLTNWRIHGDSLNATKEDFQKAMATYCGQIRGVDDQLGRIIDKLTELDQLNNTIIVFWGDHGEFLGDYGVTHKGAMFYESLMNVPICIYDPSGQLTKMKKDDFIENIDVYPTILSLLGIDQLPKSKGQSLIADDYSPRVDVFAEGGIYAKVPKKPLGEMDLLAPSDPTQWGAGSMLRTPEYKLVVYADDVNELFDLVNDPAETKNLFNDPHYTEIKLKLMLRLLNRQQNQGQPPEFAPTKLVDIFNRNQPSYHSMENFENMKDYYEKTITK